MKGSRSRSKVSKDEDRKETESVEMQSWSSSSESIQEAMETDDILGKKLMSDAEQAEHLQLCMKLAAENKINAKNAFGLHLIDIMRHLSTTGHLLSKDLQEASMSLAASTSIYVCRVDALYKETMLFHSNLQTLAGKKKKKMETDNDDEDAGSLNSATSGKSAGRLEKRKFKSRLANENDVTQNSSKDSHAISRREPHENFAIINASFSCSRTCRKLLHNLQLSSDGSRMDFTVPKLILRPRQNCPVSSDISLLPRIFRELDNIKQFDVKNCLFEEISSEVACTTPGSFKSANRSSRASSQFFSQDDVFSPSFSEGDHMCENDDLVLEESGEKDEVEFITEKMTNMDITCDIFVSDLAKALTEVAGGRDVNVDATLLPVDSLLKQMLDRHNGTLTKPPGVKTKTKRAKKEHVPFYNLNDQLATFDGVVKLYNPGKNITVSDDPSDWGFEYTSVKERGYMESDAEVDETGDGLNKELHGEILKIESAERIRALKVPFLKGEQKVVQNSVKNTIFFIDSEKKHVIENPVTMLSSGDTKDADEIIASFKQMSLHDEPSENVAQSFHEMEELGSEDLNVDQMDDDNFAEQSFIDEHTLQNLMVEPPILVKPSFIKFEKKQTNVDTDLVKKEMFRIISSSFEKHAGDSNLGAYFSEVYTELKKKRFKMSMQYAFVILLLLSNEKCLLLKSMEDSPDILILQDINEVE